MHVINVDVSIPEMVRLIGKGLLMQKTGFLCFNSRDGAIDRWIMN